MRKKIINILYQNYFLNWLLPFFHRIIGKSRLIIRGGNYCDFHNSVIYHSKIDLGIGRNNTVTVGEETFISNAIMNIKGSDNQVIIGDDGFVNGLQLTLEGNGNRVLIGNNVFILDDTRMIVVDGSSLVLGNGCMLSDRIDIRTTDNHSIFDRTTGERINNEENITIGDNVWIGTGVNILKGAVLPSGTIVGARSVVTRQFDKENCIIVGNPAKKVRDNIQWTMARKESLDRSK